MFNMSWKKKAAWTLATAGVVSICLITYLASNSPLLAQKSTASNQEVNNTVGNGQSKIEHIKVLNKDGSYIETWRNLATGEERVDTVDAANHLQNRTIVTENGSRIYVISNVEGKLVGETWKLPEAIANENQKIYKLSLIESKKTQYSKLEKVGKEKVNGKEAVKLKHTDNNPKFGEVTRFVFIDETTGLPFKTETYHKTAGKDVLVNESTEEYNVITDVPENLFKDFAGAEIKEVTEEMNDKPASNG